MRRFDLEGFLSAIGKYDINEMAIVPPIAIAIIMSPLSKQYSLKTIKLATCGAAPLGKESQARLRQLLSPEAIVIQVWGMTETSCIGTTFYDPEDDITGSVGRPMPGCDVK